jgi:hypothetical protein
VRESKLLIHEMFPQSAFFFEPWLASCRHILAGDLTAQIDIRNVTKRKILRLVALCVSVARTAQPIAARSVSEAQEEWLTETREITATSGCIRTMRGERGATYLG